MLAWLAVSTLCLIGPPQLPETAPAASETEPAVDVVPPPVQTPATMAEPAEPGADPAPAEPAASAETPAAGAPVSEPSAAVPEAALDPVEPAPILQSDTRTKYVRVDRPGFRGSGLFASAGAALGAGIIFQISDRIVCGGCGPGITERVFFTHTFALAALGGAVRGRADAFDDTVVGRERDADRAKVAGAVLVGLGSVLGLVNEGLWWSNITGDGPYADLDFVRAQAISRVVLNVSVISGSVGVGLLTWQARYRRDREAYRNARVISVAPSLGGGQAGLRLQGRF